jgi:TonB family protein
MDAATQELIDSLDNEVKTFALARSAPILDDGAYPLLAPAPEGPDNTVSVEESAPNAKSYDVTVRTAVARRWLLPPEARANFQPGRFTASMTLNPSGELILIVVDESTGNQALDYAAMEALRGAAPYEPFPPELRHLESMTFRVNFDYRAVARRGLPQG